MKIKGKCAIISGASQGIGAAIARAFADNGCKVLLLARTESLLSQIAEKINQAQPLAYIYAVDMNDQTALFETLKQISSEHGTPDIIVNNVGMGQFKRIEDTSSEEARKMMALPYFAAFDLTRYFIPEFIKRNSGHIVFINSPASQLPWGHAVAYASARFALRGFFKALTADLYGSKVRTSHVTAGVTSSNYFKNNPQSLDVIPKISKLFPVVSPEQVAKTTIRGVESNKREIVLPFTLRLAILFNHYFPRLVYWIVIRTGPKRGG